MKKESEYAIHYRDPRWQKKRLEIMSRDNFECKDCGDQTSTLNVHHIYYTRGAMPWEYPDHALVTLCESCHEIEHSMSAECDRQLIQNLKKCGIRSSQIGSLAFTIEHLIAKFGDNEAKSIIEKLDFLAFRFVIDGYPVLSKFHDFLEETRPKNCGFNKSSEETKDLEP